MSNSSEGGEEPPCRFQNSVGALQRAGVTKAPKEVTRNEWTRILDPFQFAVLREGYTERAGTGKYVKTMQPGTYHCAACGAILFNSNDKFASNCGWASFSSLHKSISGSVNVGTKKDFSHGIERMGIHCERCNSHLGHLFDDGPRPSRQRYCVNSTALEFVPLEEEKKA